MQVSKNLPAHDEANVEPVTGSAAPDGIQSKSAVPVAELEISNIPVRKPAVIRHSNYHDAASSQGQSRMRCVSVEKFYSTLYARGLRWFIPAGSRLQVLAWQFSIAVPTRRLTAVEVLAKRQARYSPDQGCRRFTRICWKKHEIAISMDGKAWRDNVFVEKAMA